jgi:hypothetical protein
MGANSVDSDSYVDGSIDAVHMSANSIDSDSYVDGSIDTAHIGATQVTGAKLNNDVISAQTNLSSEPSDTDEFMVSDGGVLKRIDYSLIKGGGKIGQVVTAVDTSYRTTTSASFVTASSSATLTITPSASSSKIYVTCTGVFACYDGNDGWLSTIYRSISGGSNTNLGNATSGLASGNSVPGIIPIYFPTTMTILDSPSTTSACTYQLYILNINHDGDGSATTAIGATLSGSSNPVPTHITAFEVLA